jgi:hypothetical protein
MLTHHLKHLSQAWLHHFNKFFNLCYYSIGCSARSRSNRVPQHSCGRLCLDYIENDRNMRFTIINCLQNWNISVSVDFCQLLVRSLRWSAARRQQFVLRTSIIWLCREYFLMISLTKINFRELGSKSVWNKKRSGI